jgi:hypothetical protein
MTDTELLDRLEKALRRKRLEDLIIWSSAVDGGVCIEGAPRGFWSGPDLRSALREALPEWGEEPRS